MLGLGGGRFEEEHAAYGVPLPTLGERVDRLEEQLSSVHEQFGRVREACRAIGRNPDELTYSAGHILCCG